MLTCAENGKKQKQREGGRVRRPNFCQIVCFVSSQRDLSSVIYLNPIQVDTFHVSFITFMYTRLINDVAKCGPQYIRQILFSLLQSLNTTSEDKCVTQLFFVLPIVNDSLHVCLCLVKFISRSSSSTLLAFRKQSNIFVLYFLTLSQLTKRRGRSKAMGEQEEEEQKYCQCYFSIKFGALWDLEQ